MDNSEVLLKGWPQHCARRLALDHWEHIGPGALNSAEVVFRCDICRLVGHREDFTGALMDEYLRLHRHAVPRLRPRPRCVTVVDGD